MLKLNASYSKKVPAEGEYTSQSFHAQIEIELPDGLTQQQLQEKVRNVFELVRTSVEAELHNVSQTNAQFQLPQQQLPPAPVQGNGYVQQPQQMQQMPPPQQMQQPYYEPVPQQPAPAQNGNYSRRQGNSKGGQGAASPKQINYLMALVKRNGWTVQSLLQRCHVQAIEDIPAKTCSEIIQELSGQAA